MLFWLDEKHIKLRNLATWKKMKNSNWTLNFWSGRWSFMLFLRVLCNGKDQLSYKIGINYLDKQLKASMHVQYLIKGYLKMYHH